jgi:hypothetical protein
VHQLRSLMAELRSLYMPYSLMIFLRTKSTFSLYDLKNLVSVLGYFYSLMAFR